MRQGLWRPARKTQARAENAGDFGWGVRGEGRRERARRRIPSLAPGAGFVCWGWTAPRRQEALSPKGRDHGHPRGTEGCPYGCLTSQMAQKKGSIRTFAAWLQLDHWGIIPKTPAELAGLTYFPSVLWVTVPHSRLPPEWFRLTLSAILSMRPGK